MTLLSEFRYTDPEGVVWIAPVGKPELCLKLIHSSLRKRLEG
jgi:hypothetical protein